MEVSCQFRFPAALRPARNAGTHLIGGWVGPRTGLDSFGGKKPLAAAAILTQDCPVRSLSLPRLLYTLAVTRQREGERERERVCCLNLVGLCSVVNK
jgi:hypothetical protein